jgi:hypothetical protein
LTAEETATANSKISAVKGKAFADADARFEELETQFIALDAKKANKVQEAWIMPTLLNGVTNYAGGLTPVCYYKNDFNTVCLNGISSSVAAGTIIFTLPVGYRPSKRLFISTVVGNGFGWIQIYSDGRVTLGNGFASTVYISYGGITFRAEG